MNRHEKAKEFESKISNGEIYECTIDELIEYLIAISDYSSALAAKYQERASHIQTLNSLIMAKTIKSLNSRNSVLTCVVIVLAIFTLITACIQIFF